MDSKMIAIAYLISLGVFFVFLVIATIVVIASSIKKKKKAKKAKKAKQVEYDDADEVQEIASDEMSIFDEAVMQATSTPQAVIPVSNATSVEAKEAAVAPAYKKEEKPENSVMKAEIQESVTEVPQVVPIIPDIAVATKKNEIEDTSDQEADVSSVENIKLEEKDIEEDSSFDDSAFDRLKFVDTAYTDSAFAEDTAFSDSAFADSAFADSAFTETSYDNTSFPGSAFENVAPQMVATATTGFTPGVVNTDEMQSGPTGNFYWFNKEDVADRPEYKPVEMYYRHFRVADECIEDLLIEMYDCALVRTEEIRYIAYGIEPRHVAMRDVAATGNAAYNASKKKKEPTKEDLDKIYRKWCSYVDKLFEIVEFHADNTTIGIIRDKLYEFGKSDVNTLIEGK